MQDNYCSTEKYTNVPDYMKNETILAYSNNLPLSYWEYAVQSVKISLTKAYKCFR